jgi:hypothetical protein
MTMTMSTKQLSEVGAKVGAVLATAGYTCEVGTTEDFDGAFPICEITVQGEAWKILVTDNTLGHQENAIPDDANFIHLKGEEAALAFCLFAVSDNPGFEPVMTKTPFATVARPDPTQ